jgi:hypothetical protein
MGIIPSFEQVHKERQEFVARQIPREDSNITEGIKALLAINGGGIVSMLGFMQALISKPAAFAGFKYFGANALLSFCVGIVAAAAVPVLRAIYVNALIFKSIHDEKWEKASYAMWGFSLLCFMIGATCVGLGIDRGLP